MAITRPARVVAPLALLVCIAAVLVVVQSSLHHDAASTASTPRPATTTTASAPKKGAKTYRVRSGDTLGAIAERTGVPVDTLMSLNPKIDPQTLRTGQRLRLRR